MPYIAPFVPDASQRIVSIENDGFWTMGQSYTVTWYYHYWDAPWIVNNYIYRIAPMMPYDLTQYSINPANIVNPVFSTEDDADNYVVKSPNGDRRFVGLNWTEVSTLSMNSDISHSYTKGDDLGGIGPTEDHVYYNYFMTSTFVVSANAAPGEYILAYLGFYKNLVPSPDVNTETQREYTTITILSPGSVPPAPFPVSDRPDDYDPGAVWDPLAGVWTTPSALTTAGGGRFPRQIVAVGNLKIYYGDL